MFREVESHREKGEKEKQGRQTDRGKQINKRNILKNIVVVVNNFGQEETFKQTDNTKNKAD